MSALNQLKKDFAQIKFVSSDRFQWSPKEKIIYYAADVENSDWSLLHEAGHMICGHAEYSSDLGLLRAEVEAWDKARKLAGKYRQTIDEEHIEKCLDTYRDWIYKRSSCPKCTQAGIEKSTGQYRCINCGHTWKVSSDRFCRIYRKTVTV